LFVCVGLASMASNFIDFTTSARLGASTLLAFEWVIFAVAAMGLLSTARASQRQSRQGAGLVSVLAPPSVLTFAIIGALGSHFSAAATLWPELWGIASGNAKTASVSLSPDGSRLTVSGEIRFGLTARIRSELDKAPSIRVLELRSPGGYAQEGLTLAYHLLSRDVDTLVTDYCASACVTVYAAGRRRFLGPSGRISLHSAQRQNESMPRTLDERHAAVLRSQGVQEWLIAGEMNTPFEDIWSPGLLTLQASGLVTDLLPSWTR